MIHKNCLWIVRLLTNIKLKARQATVPTSFSFNSIFASAVSNWLLKICNLCVGTWKSPNLPRTSRTICTRPVPDARNARNLIAPKFRLFAREMVHVLFVRLTLRFDALLVFFVGGVHFRDDRLFLSLLLLIVRLHLLPETASWWEERGKLGWRKWMCDETYQWITRWPPGWGDSTMGANLVFSKFFCLSLKDDGSLDGV